MRRTRGNHFSLAPTAIICSRAPSLANAFPSPTWLLNASLTLFLNDASMTGTVVPGL